MNGIVFRFNAKAKGFKDVKVSNVYLYFRSVHLTASGTEEKTGTVVEYGVSFRFDTGVEEYVYDDFKFDDPRLLKEESYRESVVNLLRNLRIYQEQDRIWEN